MALSTVTVAVKESWRNGLPGPELPSANHPRLLLTAGFAAARDSLER